MAVYTPITDVMPLASMVTGAAVSAALGDQIRDNLVALYDGWWFRASKSTTTVMSGAVNTPFELDTIIQSQSSEDDGTISLLSGDVRLRKSGLWLVGAHWNNSATVGGPMAIQLGHSDWSVFVTQAVNDASSGIGGMCCSGVVEQTSADALLQFSYYSTNSTTVQVNERMACWGVWMGANP